MDCFYINLDGQTDRRERIEANFAAVRTDGWRLSRFRAIDADHVRRNNVKGRMRDAIKACFLSHRTLIREVPPGPAPFLVLEDDALFGEHTCSGVDQILGWTDPTRWDLFFTDLCVFGLDFMAEMIRHRRKVRSQADLILLDLANHPFAGATAYVVNGLSREKILGLLDSQAAIDIPYDLFLRQMIHEGRLRAFAAFPFLTSLSEWAEASSIQQLDVESADPVWNQFRRMIWMDRNLATQGARVRELQGAMSDEESNLFGALFAAMLSEKYQAK